MNKEQKKIYNKRYYATISEEQKKIYNDKYQAKLYQPKLSELKKEQEKILKELTVRKGKEDLIFFFEKILCDSDNPNMFPLAPIHHEIVKELDRFWNSDETDLLILLSRGFLKSSLVSIGWTIQQIINNPNIRVFITNERGENSRKFLRQISANFESNPRLRYYYGDFTNKNEGELGKWTETEIVVSKRTTILKEPTVGVSSTEASPVSSHWDLVIVDDCVSRANTQTKDQTQKVIQYLKDLKSIGDKGTKYVYIGTRYRYDDPYAWLINNMNAEKGDLINGMPATRNIKNNYL